MSKQRSIFKWWGAWNDHRIEAWLEQMAAQGWHLESVGAVGPYRFVEGAPAQVAYRIDFWPRKGIDASYEQLFRDAGWELASHAVGWSFWRHPYRNGRAPEIFTDAASKIAKYQRWLRATVILLLAQLLTLLAAGVLMQGPAERLAGLAVGGLIGSAFTIFCMTSLMARIKELKCSSS
jgi:hypothetical protein